MALPIDSHSSILTIDLDAVASNYRLLRSKVSTSTTAAVVKANAYGLGADILGPLFQSIGCTTFFVATLDEGVQLRSTLPKADIHVFNGVLSGWPEVMNEYRLHPVLNSIQQIKCWHKYAEKIEIALTADIHIDTGMSRLGLTPNELKQFIETPIFSNTINLDLVISHLATADTPDHPMNQAQLKEFKQINSFLRSKRVSLAASSGIFLGANYHFDLVRPGIALYGGNPLENKINPMEQVVRLQGRILQVRSVETPQSIGYGASYMVPRPMRIATVGIGYGDGYLRSLSNTGKVWIEDYEAPVVGRVSMDLTTVDISQIPEHLTQVGTLVDFFGPHQTIDNVAKSAGTIDYELLTNLGTRFHRVYVGGQ